MIYCFKCHVPTSNQPIYQPTFKPTNQPTNLPTNQPTNQTAYLLPEFGSPRDTHSRSGQRRRRLSASDIGSGEPQTVGPETRRSPSA